MAGMNNSWYRGRHSMRRPRLRVVGLVLGLTLVVGQSVSTIAANASGDTGARDNGLTVVGSRGDDSTTHTTVVGSRDDGSWAGSSGSRAAPVESDAAVASGPLQPLGQPKVDFKWYGLDPTKYNHTTGLGGTIADGLLTSLEAKDFQCDDLVVFYGKIEASDLVGTNTTTVNLSFAHETSSNQSFGFSAGSSYALAKTDPAYTGNGNETLSPASPNGFGGGGASDTTLSFQVGNIEGSEAVWVRVVVILGNCGPGNPSGTVHTGVDSASTVNDATGNAVNTSAGAQTVPLKFTGSPTGTITIVKDLNPAADPGTFNLQLAGSTLATGGDGTTTGAQNVLAGTYSVGETGAGGTNLGDYTTQIVCQNGTAPPLAAVNSTSTNLTVAGGDAWVCTITNTRKPVAAPQLKLVKTVTNDDGGAATPDSWTLSATAAAPNDGRNFSNLGGSGAFQDVFAGVDYTLGEAGPAGYTAGDWSCPGGTMNATKTTVTVALGASVTCTINNDDIAPVAAPQLKLVKTVTNDDGGAATPDSWTLSATAAAPNAGRNFSNLGGSGVLQDVFAGVDYTLGEAGPAGYTAGDWRDRKSVV